MDARAHSTRADLSPSGGGDAPRPTEPRAPSVARRLLILGMLAVLLVSPVACGSSPARDAETPKPPEVVKEATTPGEAEDAFNRAERELQQELVAFGYSQPGVTPAPVPTPAPGQSSYGPQPLPPPGYPQGTNDDDARAYEARQSRCSRACRALASMSRSADRLCELDGEDTDRCRNVRQRVDAARRLVTATCPDCR